MKFNRCFYILVLFTLFCGVVLSEQSIEVTVDNVPEPSKEELNANKALKDELEREKKNYEMKKAQFEKQLTEKNEIIKELRMQLEKKQEEYAHLQDVVNTQNSKISVLKEKEAKLQDHIKRISAPLTFVDFIVDVFESYILPGYEWTVARTKVYYPIALDYVESQRKVVVTTLKNNETCQMIWSTAVKYYKIAINWIVSFWKDVAYPKIDAVLTPYYPMIHHYYIMVCEYLDFGAKKVVESAKNGFTSFVGFCEQSYVQMKNHPVFSQYADFILYGLIVCVLMLVMKLVCLILCVLCPCRRCCCCKCRKC